MRRNGRKIVILVISSIFVVSVVLFTITAYQLLENSDVATEHVTSPAAISAGTRLQSLSSIVKPSVVRPQDVLLRTTVGGNETETASLCFPVEIEHLEFPLCCYRHGQFVDSVVSRTFLAGGYFEADDVSRLMRRLQSDPSVSLVDIGAHVSKSG